MGYDIERTSLDASMCFHVAAILVSSHSFPETICLIYLHVLLQDYLSWKQGFCQLLLSLSPLSREESLIAYIQNEMVSLMHH